MQNLTPTQVQLLNDAWTAVFKAYNALECLRPAGGFNELVDKSRYCPTCLRPVVACPAASKLAGDGRC